jgi:hypothetical protein
MMYKELEKYRTGGKLQCQKEMIGSGETIMIMLDEYEANLGDLLNDFIEHKQKPFWERKNYHNHLTELYIKMLNKFTIKHGF